jgi:type VI secretion system protein ImpC
MPPPFSLRSAQFNLGTEPETAPSPIPAEGPFKIGILGDFRGRQDRGARLSDGPRPMAVDRDNLEVVMAGLGVELHVPLAGGGSPLVLRFRELDDFRPERLRPQIEPLTRLEELRGQLGNSASPQASPKADAGTAAPAASLLDAVLAKTVDHKDMPLAMPGGGDWDAYLRKIIAGHMAPTTDPRQAELAAQVEAMEAVLLRAVLHHPAFQALESAWRGLDFLVRRLDTDGNLKLYLLDWTRDELVADLAVDDLSTTQAYRLLVEPALAPAGGRPWAVLMGNYTFGSSDQDAALLERLAAIARQAGAPFVAAASPALVDGKDQAAWAALRRSPAAAFLGLALPRFLLRLPYGNDTAPVEGFTFEEMPAGTDHESYLWGNPAFACIGLLGEAFLREGWALDPNAVRELGGLPLHIYTADDESQIKPCAEVVLGERAMERIRDAGIMPLLCDRGSDRLRLPGFRSLALPPAPLSGRWQKRLALPDQTL